MTRNEFRDLLRNHDWHFQMSDDPRCYHSGLAMQKTIAAHGRNDPEFAADMKEASDWMFSGAPWGRPKLPMPDWWRKRPARDVLFFSPGAAPDGWRPSNTESCIVE
jgi:hypothetical protein